MRRFIDIAVISYIERYLVDEVTTNPTLLSKCDEFASKKEVSKRIGKLNTDPISVEVTSENCDGMVKEAQQHAKISSNIVIKVPMVEEGLKATISLKKLNININVTLFFSSNQALLTANVGATCASIFAGRLDDQGTDGMQVIRDSLKIFNRYSFSTQIIAASIRGSPCHMKEAAKTGCHIATVPSNIIDLIIKYNLTDIGFETFLRDAQKNCRCQS